jgi:hypothetical protein
VEPVQPCDGYVARPSGRAVYTSGAHAFKIYYLDVVGRTRAEQYEWDRCGRSRQTLLAGLERAGVEGVGFVCAFPHIAKVFRFAPSTETTLHVRAFRPADFADLELARADGYTEYACLAESVIADGEYRLWARADSVDAYLREWIDMAEVAIADPGKLARRYGSGLTLNTR